ncbi:MAG: outer membrane beta-barrel protein [Candidatus Omnitrophica bacterium]|nr:outer membrane beta-barrel protein [Candidatus Omnitrophota bacterium]
MGRWITTGICMVACAVLPAAGWGEVTRGDLIDGYLKYYQLEEKEREEKERQEELRRQKEEALMREREARRDKSEQRARKMKKVLERVKEDLLFVAELESIYSDNVFKTSEDEESDFVTSLTLGLSYEPEIAWRKGHTSVKFDLEGGPNITITDNDELNANRFLAAGAVQHVRGKYGVGIEGGAERDFSTASDFTLTGEKKLVEFWRYRYGVELFADWAYLPSSLQYTHKTTEHDGEFSAADLDEDVIELTTKVNVFPKTGIKFDYQYGSDEYPNRGNKDGTYHSFQLGLSGKISPKIKGDILGGIKQREIDDGSDVEETTTTVDLVYDISEHLSAAFEASRDVSATAVIGESWSKDWEIILGLEYRPPFNRRLTMFAGGEYKSSEYSSAREDEYLELSLRSRLALNQWLSCEGAYTFEDRTSNTALAEYTQNEITLSLTAEF